MDTAAVSSPEPQSLLFAWVRFWLAMVVTAVTATLLCFSALFGFLMPAERGRRWMLNMPYLWGVWVLKVARCPVQVTFLARDEIPQKRFLYFSNHMSMLDILALFVALHDTPFAFAAKKELFSVPVIGWYLHFAGFVMVDRQNRDRAVLAYDAAAKSIRERDSVIAVYPEGTRSIDGTVLPFKKGPFMLAIAAQVPIVPVAVDGAQLALRKHTLRLYGHPIRVVVGKPIPTEGLTVEHRDDLLRRVRTAVLEQHKLAGGEASPLEPMIAPAGKQSGERPS